MDSTKEADLVTAVLMYAMRCLAEGDQTALRNMNFGVKEIEALREMRIADLYRIESLRSDNDFCRCPAGNDAGIVWAESAGLHATASNPVGRTCRWSTT